jgi:hypothetical protein
MLSAPNGQGEPQANGQAQLSPLKARVHAYLAANPELADGTVNEVLASLRVAGTHVWRTTVAEVLQRRREIEKSVTGEQESRLS